MAKVLPDGNDGDDLLDAAERLVTQGGSMTGAVMPTPSTLANLREATLSKTPVSLGRRRTSSPHEFYRYPARFSPAFAEAAIECYSVPGQVVLDPFVGGGTTAVEAMRLSRRAIVADLNPLATFVTRAKTTVLDEEEIAQVETWLNLLPSVLNLRGSAPSFADWAEDGYFRHIEGRDTWRIKKLVSLALGSIGSVDSAVERFCRCVVLRTAQWALDMRSILPSAAQFRETFTDNGFAMLRVLREFISSIPADTPSPIILDEGLPGLADRLYRMKAPMPSLVVTSPPYPGVYVNYHRWKLLGRKEIPAPYWIADRRDGHGLAHYTMSARAEPTLNTYFSRLEAAFRDLAQLVAPTTTLVQMVGFNNPHDQLPRYLAAMNRAGFVEVLQDGLASADDGRLWRFVPGRRWWTEAQTKKAVAPHTAREVVLVHRPAHAP